MVKKCFVVCFILIVVILSNGYALEDITLELDKGYYQGISDQMEISATAFEHNKNKRVAEQILVNITTSDSSLGISVFLVETGPNTGVFTGQVRFSFDSSSSKDKIIKVRNNIIIYVEYEGIVSTASWIPYDARVMFDSNKYTGLGETPNITVVDFDLDKDSFSAEAVTVFARAKHDTILIPIVLIENAADSGVFCGYLNFSEVAPSIEDGTLHVQYNDEITIYYLDKNNTSGVEKLCSDNAIWIPYTATLAFDKTAYSGLNSLCKITVTDSDMNTNHLSKDIAFIKVSSDLDRSGIELKLYETANNSGVFTTEISLDKYSSNASWNELKVGASSIIKAVYCDKWNGTNKKYTNIAAIATFQYVEGTISATNAPMSTFTGSSRITVRDPDADISDQRNTLPVNVVSSSDSKGLTLWLEETGSSTGSFSGILYFSTKPVYDRLKKDTTIRVAQNDNIEITYNDTTHPKDKSKPICKKYKWSHQKAEVKLDKSSYVGYNSSAVINVTDYEANKNSRAIDKVRVFISTSSLPEFSMLVNETGNDSGQFKGVIYFGKKQNLSKSIIKIASNDKISIKYNDQGEYSFGTVLANAMWKPHNTELTLNSEKYYGDNAKVSITLKDWDIAQRTTTIDCSYVDIAINDGSDTIKLPLKETGKNTGVFCGTIIINGEEKKYRHLSLKDGDQISVHFVDKDNTSNKPVERKASAIWNIKKQ